MTRPDELRLEAERKRKELAETLDQLVARADLRARAARMDRRPLVAAATAAALAVLAAVLMSRPRHAGGRR